MIYQKSRNIHKMQLRHKHDLHRHKVKTIAIHLNCMLKIPIGNM